ncbi:MAG TPA: hypothetical protein VF272_01290 [Candidatus Saccharimonadia bacterium]
MIAADRLANLADLRDIVNRDVELARDIQNERGPNRFRGPLLCVQVLGDGSVKFIRRRTAMAAMNSNRWTRVHGKDEITVSPDSFFILVDGCICCMTPLGNVTIFRDGDKLDFAAVAPAAADIGAGVPAAIAA